jgi:hypothetical protein
MKTALIAVTVLALTAGTVAVSARQGGMSGGGMQNGPLAACQMDFDYYCSGDKRGTAKFKSCIRENRAKFSSACREAMAQSRQHNQQSGGE